jgi:hypothetical protein
MIKNGCSVEGQIAADKQCKNIESVKI